MKNKDNRNYFNPSLDKKHNTEDGSALTTAQQKEYDAIIDAGNGGATAFYNKCEEENRTPEYREWLKRGISEGVGIDVDDL